MDELIYIFTAYLGLSNTVRTCEKFYVYADELVKTTLETLLSVGLVFIS